MCVCEGPCSTRWFVCARCETQMRACVTQARDSTCLPDACPSCALACTYESSQHFRALNLPLSLSFLSRSPLPLSRLPSSSAEQSWLGYRAALSSPTRWRHQSISRPRALPTSSSTRLSTTRMCPVERQRVTEEWRDGESEGEVDRESIQGMSSPPHTLHTCTRDD